MAETQDRHDVRENPTETRGPEKYGLLNCLKPYGQCSEKFQTFDATRAMTKVKALVP